LAYTCSRTILLVTDGKGWYQEKGKIARPISKGDVVVIPSNIEHWHGASKDNSLTHLAITTIQKKVLSNGCSLLPMKNTKAFIHPEQFKLEGGLGLTGIIMEIGQLAPL
jgi:hypothetical protein